MFEIGEKVVCVDAEWRTNDEPGLGEGCPLVHKRIYIVLDFKPEGYNLDGSFCLDTDVVSVGVKCPLAEEFLSENAITSITADFWEADRFRKIVGKTRRVSGRAHRHVRHDAQPQAVTA